MQDVAIIGGGLAGLLTAYELSKKGLQVTLIEKKAYPFHRVCGEYISNEIRPYLEEIGLYPHELQPAPISRFQLTTVKGRSLEMPLDMGGFGISRYKLDQYFYRKAQAAGTDFKLQTEVRNVEHDKSHFRLQLSDQTSLESRLVIGAHGKRARLDNVLERRFFKQRSPWIGVKYHIKADLPDDTVSLHNFPGGYCGINKVEDDRFNLCYLSHRENLKENGSIEEMEARVLGLNPFLKDILQNAQSVFKKPLVINEISFRTKSAVEQHILMAGDSAGMITPLCGNGMAMAMHSAKILSETILKNYKAQALDLQKLEKAYAVAWKRQFSSRMWYGRQIQKIFGAGFIAEGSVALARNFSPFAHLLMKQTHGKVVENS